MSRHLSDDQITRYRELLPAELLSLDDHVAECETCRKRLLLMHQTPYTLSYVKNDLLTSMPIHISYDQMESYVDEISDETDREIIESHASICERCRELLQDLKNTALQTKVQSKKTTWSDKVSFLWHSPDYSAPFRTLTYAAFASFIALALIIIMSADSNLKTQLKEANKQNKELQKQLAQLQKTSQPVIPWDNVDAYPEPYKKMSETVLAKGSVAIPPFVQELRGNQKILMGEQQPDGAFRVLSPVGIVVESTRPNFHWAPLSGAKYIVRVYDEQYNLVASGPFLTEPMWTPANLLERGKRYIWDVTATVEDRELRAPLPPAPQAKFQIIEESKLKDLNAIRSQYPQSHLLLGLAYVDSGLMNEAVDEFEKLKKDNPNSALVQKLWSSLQDFNWKSSVRN